MKIRYYHIEISLYIFSVFVVGEYLNVEILINQFLRREKSKSEVVLYFDCFLTTVSIKNKSE